MHVANSPTERLEGDLDREDGVGSVEQYVVTLSEVKNEQAECDVQHETTPHGPKTDGYHPMYIRYSQSKINFWNCNGVSRAAL